MNWAIIGFGWIKFHQSFDGYSGWSLKVDSEITDPVYYAEHNLDVGST